MADCGSVILSEEYADFIVNFIGNEEEALNRFSATCFQRISSYYGSIYRPLNSLDELALRNYSFGSIPALYGLMERDIAVRVRQLELALDRSGILKLQNQPVLKLKGQGCIMAFIDTGIDILDDEFRYSNGETRILRIWDMEDETGTPPKGLLYGSEYVESEINRVLQGDGGAMISNEEQSDLRNIDRLAVGVQSDVASDNDNRISKQKLYGKDNLNHGNILARIAAGNNGAVPESYIVVVKLKPAKRYLRDYYFVKDDVPAYQENDIMLAINYVRSVSLEMNMPISLCLALGTNGRSHDGESALSYIIDRFVSSVGAVVSISTGDEGNKQLHGAGRVGGGIFSAGEYSGLDYSREEAVGGNMSGGMLSTERDKNFEVVEIRVDERQAGLVINVWGGKPGLISVGVVSPTGEVIERVPPRIGKSEIYNLVFDGTTVSIEYDLVEGDSGDELIVVRLEKPTAGVWSLRIYGEGERYNVYLPVSQFIYENTYILEPEPDITIVDPALAEGAISTSLYEPLNGALYIDNGRGFSRNGAIKPELSTVMSASITAGAACQFLNWGIVNERDAELRASDIKSYLIRGAIRETGMEYPNRQWGYGRLDVYNSFEMLKM